MPAARARDVTAVWSLWTRPTRTGWPNWRDHLLSWALSVETARPHFARTRLVTDTPGAELLTEKLGLAFDAVTTELDALAEADPDLWALGKLHAYAAQTAPFLHIDADVYLWTPPVAGTLPGVFAAYPETRPWGDGVYRSASLLADLRRHHAWIPPELDAQFPFGGIMRSENCALVGGSRPDFLAHYAAQAIRLVDDPTNQPVWARRRSAMADMVIFEQQMLAACIDYHRGRPGSRFADLSTGYMFPTEAEAFRRGGEAGFTHLISGAKHDPAVRARLAARVARAFPALFARAEDCGMAMAA